MQLDLRVLDRDGQFVSDLSRDEFRVFEDGKEQTITNFALINVPIERPATVAPNTPRVDPDVVSNVHDDGRLYVIVLDDLETQASPLRAPTVRAIAREFIENNLTDADRAALITTSGRRDMAQDFTGNRERLLAAAAKYEGGYGQQTTTYQSPGLSFANPGGDQVSDNLHSTMLSLTALAKWLAAIDGRRKSMVLVSERLGRSMGADIDLDLATGEASDATDFVQAARRGNVSLYILDPVGVPGGRTGSIKPTQADVDDGSVLDDGRIQSLVTLAEATGGFAAVRSNDYSGALRRIVVESSSYYLLGYISSNPARDGKYRKTEVRVTRPDLRVQSRSGYVAPKGATPVPTAVSAAALPTGLREILQNPLAVSGLPLTVSAPVFYGTDSKASVAVIVETGANQLQFSPDGARFNAGMTLAIAASDMNGKIQGGERGSLNMRLSSQTYDAVLDRGARLVSKIDLKPGRYLLKVAALDAASDITKGSVQYDLDVPDFSKGPLTISGLALAALRDPPLPTTGPDRRWQDALGTFPTAHRDFTAENDIREYIELYDNDTRATHSIEATTTITSATGATVYRSRTSFPSAKGQSKPVIHRLSGTIALKDLIPGRYVLAVEAHSSASAGKTVSRQVPFTIKR